MRAAISLIAVAGSLASCAMPSPPSAQPPAGEAQDTCKAQPGQAFIGRAANSETGAQMLAATGARTLRWVPPDTAVTMEYMYGRLTVGYDRAMIITSVSCS